MTLLSIIIPIAPNEDNLMVEDDLKSLPDDVEIIRGKSLEISGRAVQMNRGAKEAKGEFLWFLHSDSKLSGDSFIKLSKAIEQYPDKLHYFKLGFYDGSKAMKITEIGANLRSGLLGVPFGDQGFCISKKKFDKVGGYPENAEYGEDHLFIWYARQKGIKLNRINSVLYTSARKYRENGWFKVTLQHQIIWLKQAVPELIKLLRVKIKWI